jgi:general stress protein 26
MSGDGEADWGRFWDLVKDIRFPMFTAHAADGRLHSRPMTTQNASGDRADTLWFFMSQRSEPVLDISRMRTSTLQMISTFRLPGVHGW